MSQATPAPDERQIELSRSHEKADKMDEKFDNSNIGVSALTGVVESIDTNGPEARKILRKIDCHLLPILSVTYFIQFLDKSCVSYAALWGMREDAHLEGSQYSWLTTMFYIGYLVSKFPINFLFQKFDIARTCGIFIILWGIVLLCMTAAHDFAGLATARFFLGALEAGVSPCFVLLTAMFYKRSEQPFRTSLWFSMNGMANILGGLLGYAIGFMDTDIPTWKFPFVIFGSLTIVWGALFLFLTPSNPTKTKWLTEEEKTIAVMRLAENETGIDNKQWKWYQVKEAFMDPRFWLLNLLALANNIPGRVRLVGTPAEEGMGGKIPIIEAGAYQDVDACMMVHPGPVSECEGFTGDAYMPTLANHKFNIQFKGHTAHAAVAPWEGVNALDAAVLAYNGISVLRQQVHPSNRIHCIISEGGLRPNVIPGAASLDCYIRCPTLKGADELLARVKKCFEGAALQSGCEMEFTMVNTYADLRSNKTVCSLYADAMTKVGSEVKCDFNSPGVPGSTDQGNVTYECPGIQAYVGVQAEKGCINRTAEFTAIAGTEESHRLCVEAAKGMAIAGWRIIADSEVAAMVRDEFEEDKKIW